MLRTRKPKSRGRKYCWWMMKTSSARHLSQQLSVRGFDVLDVSNGEDAIKTSATRTPKWSFSIRRCLAWTASRR